MFVIVGLVNDNFVLLSDGDLRKMEDPKVKNLKHIHFTNMTADKVLEYLLKGEIPGNHVVRKNLKVLLEARETKGKEVW
jgi:hypothetical protein